MPNYHKSRNRNRNKNKNRNNNSNSNSNSNNDNNRQNRLNQNNSQQHLKDKEKCNVNEVESVEITTKATTQLPVSAESVSVVNLAIDETNERDDVTASNTIAHIGNEVHLLSKEPKPTIGTSSTVSFEHTKGNEAIIGYGQAKSVDPNENMGNNKSKEVEHINMPNPVNGETITNTNDILLESNLQKQPVEGKIIVHRVLYEGENEANNSIASNLSEHTKQNSIGPLKKPIVHNIHIDLEEDDEKPYDDECKEEITNRSQVEICEVNEDIITNDLPIVQSPIVTEVESESEDLAKIEFQDDAVKTSDHIFQYDENLDTRQRSKQKKLAIQNHFLPHFLNPRYLDSITEENSDLSDYSDKVKSPLQPLKDPLKTKTLNYNSFMQATSTPLIVETRITETPGADESCSILECSQAVKPEAAETIFINSASSSITDLLDYENMEINSRTVHDTDTVNISSKSQSEETPANKKTPTAIPILTTTTISDLQPDCIDDKQIVQIAENMIMRSSSPRNIENASANSNDLVATTVVLSSSEHMPINPIAERNENFENSVALISSSSNGCETLNSILSVDHKTKQQILFENEMNNVRALLISENSLNTNGKRSSDILQNNNNNNSNNNNNNNITILTKDSPPTPTLSLTTASESIIVKLNSDPVHRNSDTHLDENNCSAGKTINADTTKSNKSVTDAQSSISDVNGATCTLKQHGNAATNLYFTYPEKLRILCAEKLESLPYGHAVLEELAKISQNIGEAKAVTSIRQTSASSKDVKMPYPLPSMPHIKDLQLHLQSRQEGTNTLPSCKPEEKLHSQTWTGIPTNSDPKVLVCISPSQRSYMEKHVEQQPDDLLSAHQKFIERRGYYEYTKSEIEAMEEEKRAEKDVLQMAAHMKKLRKSLTPTPPPIPPPPVPTKSLETSVKALNSMNQAITGDMKKATEKNSRNNADSVNKEENIKHLLEILNNTNEANQKQIPDIMSSLPENSSRQTNYKVDGNVSGMPGTPQTNANKHSQQRDHFNASDRYRKDSSNMEIGFKLKPTYSETLPLNFESKSYSKMETSSYEAKKRIENGKIVCDTSESKYDKRIETDSNNNSKSNSSNNKRESNESNFSKSEQNKTKTQTTDATNKLKEPIPPYGIEIMSDIKLNNISEITKETKNSAHSIALDWDYEKNMKSDAATEHQEHRKTNVENEAQNLCKEFRQNAKTSDLLDRLNTKTSATTNVIKDQVTSQPSLSSSSSFTSDHEKLLKEFDELSKRLHNELETNSWQKRQRELSSSMFDLSTLQMKQKQHFEEFKRRRHEHMKELEKEIEKSIKSRQLKFAEKLQNGQVHNVPIRIETDDIQNDSSFIDAKEENNRENGRVYQIPIKIENTQNDRQLLRSESMFNLGEEQHKRVHKPYANHMNQVDSNVNNWTKQRQDFGLSENITRPFAREVEICYQRQSPRVIRAPRLNDAPNDSSLESNASTSHHTSKRFSAPMFTERERPSHHASCYSMIERDPHPTYISTTTRRGVSPAPTQVSGNQPDVSQRRDSLPKSFHDQKLKHLSDKENALRAEFEQLQNERRRLLEEIQTGESSSHSSAFNTMHETYRSMQRLPTLTENEVFRQQMAEEWLSKVAEREKRRLQKVVKISKISDNSETFNKSTSTLTSTGQATDVGSEFLKRVKERRSKLAIPADSDWESGAESQPINQSQTSEAEDVSSVKFIEGKAEAKPSQLPKHLREFAKFSTAQQDQLDGNDQKEHFEEEEQSSEITENSISKALKKSWMTKTVKVSRSSRDNGQGRKLQQYSGYQSEPEPAKETDYSTIKYRTTNPQRLVSVSSNVNLRNSTSNNSFHGLTSEPIKSGYGTYKNQPGRIENYITGHSSISEKEKKRWWDEVMDIFNNVQLDQTKLSSHANDGNLARALSLESGYTSDSNLVFRKKEATQSSTLGPIEQKIAYRNVQAGGEPPLYGFRKPAPEKLKVSPNLYHESDVSIYFKTPVCQEPRSPPMTDEELASRQAEYMQKLYQEERRRKYLQELQDMNARRHTDNFTPSQKSPIALNRYDDFPADLAPKSPLKQDLQTKAVARALYNFQGQNPRELCFKKGDIIYIRRTIDKNWYEGERNAMVGLFPANYVEIISRGEIQYLKQQTRQKPSEGQARAKYNFQAQSGIELSLNKGELVSLTRRVDENWFEGRIANRKGIFPVAYVEVLIDIGAEDVVTRTDRTTHRHMDTLRSNINQEFNTLIRHGYHTQTGTNNYFPKGASQKNKTDILHVDTNVEPIVYRALYKYQPQNSDELELFEGDLVHVLEKCDDGWYVGTSQRTGCFGTFPGNYVERI
ncbi:protein PF14_0175-like isoform X13 [Glossina fuscipes]|uniref:Protein PF14_0175-like isoform X13 n=1 Tax=Glossina fuscipes TaxID=7396 RepID=A0A9C5YUD4_9MUSC|nr:protein PF14_0175-like isoform X13 [Glossina fuscipes]